MLQGLQDLTEGGHLLLRAAWTHKARGQLTHVYNPNQGDLGPSDKPRELGRATLQDGPLIALPRKKVEQVSNLFG